MAARAAIVTIVIGREYLEYWRKFCRRSWEQYAEKHGFDQVIVTEPLDQSPRARERSPAWQKCLVLGQEFSKKYERIIWIDGDILFNVARAPSLLEGVPPEKIGAVVSGDYIHPDLRPVLLERVRGREYGAAPPLKVWDEDQRGFYAQYGLDPGTGEIVQTGVLVLSPAHHRGIFEHVYHSDYPVQTRSYEQIPLSYEIMRRGLLHRLNSRFNTVFFERMIVHYPYLLNTKLPDYESLARRAAAAEFENSFLLHFAAKRGFIRYLFERGPAA